MESNLIYDFDKQKIFKAKYMTGDSRSSQEYRRHDEKSMVQGGLSSTKDKWDKYLCLVPFQQGGQICESIHFMTIRLLI